MWKSALVAVLGCAAGPAVAAANPDWILAATSSACDGTDVDFSDSLHGFATCAFGLGMTTADGGLTWTVFDTHVPQSLVWAHAKDVNELYAARLGMYRSTDAGATWNELGDLSQINDNSVFGAQLVDAQTIVVLKGSQVFRSTDGGASWPVVYTPPEDVFLHQLHRPAPDTMFVAGGITTSLGSHGSVARSSDTGQTWTLLPFGHKQVTASDFFDAGHGVVATFGGEMFTTADGGDTWTSIGALPDNGYVLDIAHRDTRWYAGTLDGCLWTSNDGGGHWKQEFCDAQARPLVALDARHGAVRGVGNDSLALFENRIFSDAFESAGRGIPAR